MQHTTSPLDLLRARVERDYRGWSLHPHGDGFRLIQERDKRTLVTGSVSEVRDYLDDFDWSLRTIDLGGEL